MATKQEEASDDAYEELVSRVERISNVTAAGGVLRWDQEVVMPEEGTPARAAQLSTLSTIAHEELTDERTGELLDELDGRDLDEAEAAVVREIRRKYDRATSVPGELVSEISEATANAHPVWKEAKADDDFEAFAPTLENLLELKREYAAHIDPDADPYAVLFAEYEPYLDLETAERVLDRLRDELVPLIEAIGESDVELGGAFDGEFDADAQEALSRDVLDALGYDWSRGRLDTAPHPFSTGTQFDARVTTRFDEEDLLGSITSTIHEFGHANYTLGLPDDGYGTPLGESRDLTVHESQSRLWENHVGRSEPFWDFFLPTAAERFPPLADVSTREAYEAANQVYDDNLIRTEADELTYHLHIIVRFEIERQLISGDLDVEDVPQVWNDTYEEYLGVRPETDAEGVLQDIHWSHGSFGYFPTYSLGSVLAAQLYAAAEDELGALDERTRNGEFDDLNGWLRESVHRHGAMYTTPALVEKATGDPYSADAFIDYVTEKYGELYELDGY
ncbi:carboxypeptidase M32 [Halovivax gelatinilyticus]|uniref:carboxypeptidase M32 n=1 Tax=Halovivax gelatinilyticus TaxID=2961597 RepID=UPI0020CA709E|nr:carboxypeptidase M32 [Halovivax gelatinilyticus]